MAGSRRFAWIVADRTTGRRLLAAALLFVFLFAALAGYFRAMPVLYDTDSYCHLGLGLDYAEKGVVRDLESVRFSAMSDGFGDKELLFHLFLSLFARPGDSQGGRLALALLGSAILTLISLLAAEAIGSWGLVAGPALLLVASDVPDRLLRLRPELAGLLLMLLATWAAARARYRTLGAIALLLALSYNIVQLLLVFVLGWAFVRWWRGGRFEWAGVLYPVLGVGLGLVLHPHFPKNLEIWSLITFEQLGRLGEFPEGGRDVLPASSADILRNNFAWWLAMAALALALVRDSGERNRATVVSESGCYSVAALGFGLLYAGAMWRFGLYFYPFATLALCHEARRFGWRVGRTVPASGRLRLPTWMVLAALAVAALIPARAMARYFLDARAPGPPREAEWRAFGAAVPAGAKVAAPWAETGAYSFWARGGRYLNMLDPIYMAVAYPSQYRAQRALFAGDLADVPLAVGTALDSEYLAFSRFLAPARLLARCAGDPRLELVYDGYNRLYRLRPGGNDGFWLDWRYTTALSTQAGAGSPATAIYPRASGAGAALEGYVDAGRTGAERGCVRFERRFELAAAERLTLELAPYGPARLAIDGVPRLELRASTGAVLGQAVRVEAELAAGAHEAVVESCPSSAPSQNGFFLRRLPPA